MTYTCNLKLFEILKEYCRPSYVPTHDIVLRLPGATITFVHKTIRIMNMCHCV